MLRDMTRAREILVLVLRICILNRLNNKPQSTLKIFRSLLENNCEPKCICAGYETEYNTAPINRYIIKTADIAT